MNNEAETIPAPKADLFDLLKISNLAGWRRKKQGPDKKYATFNRRMLAATFDSFFLLFLAPMFDRLFPYRPPILQNYSLNASDPQAAQQLVEEIANVEFFAHWLMNMTAQMVVLCLLSAVCWRFWSATPGKMLMLIKIVDAKTEHHITDRQILIRICGYVVSAVVLFLGFFWIGFDKRRQGWHDKMAGTVVVVVPWRESFLGRFFRK